jgi:HEPN domain-containing protein
MKNRQELIEEWKRIANEDLQAVKLLIQNNSGFNRTIAYHSQQYAEKMIKMLYIEHDIPFKRTHNLDELLVNLKGNISNITISDEMIDAAAELSAYAVEIRYPDASEPTKKEAINAYNMAIKLIEALYL